MNRTGSRPGSSFKLFLAGGLLAGGLVAAVLHMRLGLPWWIAYLLGVNFSTACAYFYDKTAAKRDLRRVPERLLHGMALAGGSPAALLCQKAFRHKTIKRSFRLWFWGIVVLQLAAVAAWLWYTSGRGPA